MNIGLYNMRIQAYIRARHTYVHGLNGHIGLGIYT
jgi:hypothetical protein